MAAKLDANQVIKRVFDDVTGRLRVQTLLDIPDDLTVEATPTRFVINDYSDHIGTESVQILPANSIRSFLFIQNSSKNKIWLDFDQSASAGFPSMQLNSNQILFMESSSITTSSIHAISEIENTPLVVKEG